MTSKHISREQVEHLAWLARLELTEDEKELYTKQLNDILEYFSKLNELDTEKIPPTYHLMGKTNVFREDEIKPSLSLEQALQNCPKRKENFFKAPKIM